MFQFCLVPLSALFLAAILAVPTSAQSSGFVEPEYVQALIGGDADRLASLDPLPWDSFLRLAAAELKMSVPQAAALLKMRQAGPPPTEGGSSEPSSDMRTAALLEWQRKSTQELPSTHARRLVFRAHYVFAFAVQLNERCHLFSQSLGRAVADARASAIQHINLDYSPLDRRPLEQLKGEELLNAQLLAGQSDAARLVREMGCKAAPVRSASATLSRLLAPLGPGRLQVDTETQVERAAMLRANDQAYLIANRFFRTYPSQGPYSATNIGNPDEPTYRIPSPDQQVAGVTIGWYSLPNGGRASTADGKPLLIVLVRTSDCDDCPQFLFDLLNSKSFNALAGRFNAVLLTENDEHIERVTRRLGKLHWPTIAVFRLAAPDTPAVELLRISGDESVASIALQVERVAPPNSPSWSDAAPKRPHEASTRLPAFCWLIETYELCRARIRRNPQGE